MNKFLLIALASITISSSHATPVYFTSSAGEPWGVSDFTDAMTTVFGTFTTADYETADASLFNAGTSFVFMEGSAGNDSALQSYLDTYGTAVVNWVNAGGRLMINSAGWANSINTGFGNVVLNQGDFSSSGNAVDPTSFFFQGPYAPVATQLSGGYFAHDNVTGTGLTNVVTGDDGSAIVAYEQFGSGMVLFSGATAPEWQNPQPDSYNLLDNELAFLSGQYATGGSVDPTPEPGSMLLLGAGLVGLAHLGKRLRRR